jgi:hypothetical protein
MLRREWLVFTPNVEVLPDRLLLADDGQPAIAFTQRCGKLLRSFGAGRAKKCFALASLQGDARLPATIAELRDNTLAITALAAPAGFARGRNHMV